MCETAIYELYNFISKRLGFDFLFKVALLKSSTFWAFQCVRWFQTNVSGLPIGPIFKGQAVFLENRRFWTPYQSYPQCQDVFLKPTFLDSILVSSSMSRCLLKTDVLGLPIGPIFKGQAVFLEIDVLRICIGPIFKVKTSSWKPTFWDCISVPSSMVKMSSWT